MSRGTSASGWAELETRRAQAGAGAGGRRWGNDVRSSGTRGKLARGAGVAVAKVIAVPHDLPTGLACLL